MEVVLVLVLGKGEEGKFIIIYDIGLFAPLLSQHTKHNSFMLLFVENLQEQNFI